MILFLVTTKNSHGFKNFDDRLDEFYSQIFHKEKQYTSLWLICQLVFIISHGQAAIERGFKINKELSVQNQSTDSLIALRIVNDHHESNGVTAANIPITRERVKHARAARLRYSESNETKNKEAALNAKNLKRKVIDEEIHDVRKKRKCIQDNIVYMNNEADKFSIVAEEKSDFALLKRANDLRKLCVMIRNQK